MIAELDCVALNVGLLEPGRAADDAGTVVRVIKVSAGQIRPSAGNEIHHARPVAPAAR